MLQIQNDNAKTKGNPLNKHDGVTWEKRLQKTTTSLEWFISENLYDNTFVPNQPSISSMYYPIFEEWWNTTICSKK